MVKNWADHCSSDEEEEVVEVQVAKVQSEQGPAAAADGMRNNDDTQLPREPKERVYEYPSEPPFTAFVGNLVYSITEGDALAEAVTALAAEQLQADVKIVNARIMKDRNNSDRPRGFGYVEVETVDMLRKLMELNKCEGSVIAGRRIQLDTANGGNNGNNNRRGNRTHRGSGTSGGSETDGTKFRGGLHAKKESGGSESKDGPPAQRPSLKLKPRSNPVEGAAQEGSNSNLGGSSSNIFGSAIARDEQNWQERRKSEKVQTTNKVGGVDQPQLNRRDSKSGKGRGSGGRGAGGRASGRGEQGRGGGEYGRGGDRPGGKADGSTKKSGRQEPKAAPPPAVASASKPTEPEKKAATAQVTNTFAALAFDSDSD